MPSPLAHSAMGYVIYRLSGQGQGPSAGAGQARPQEPRLGPFPLLLVGAILFSVLPDFDAVPGLLLGDMHGFHNQATHSLFAGLAAAFAAGGLARLAGWGGFWRWFGAALCAYEAHVLMDFFTFETRGVMLLWPFSAERFEASLKLFYGVRWSDGWLSLRHLITLATELGFAALVLLGSYVFKPPRLRLSNSVTGFQGEKPKILEQKDERAEGA